MTRRLSALLISIDENVEEEVLLLIGGVKVKCFVSYCPLEIRVGRRYEVELDMVLPDKCFVVAAKEQIRTVEMIDDGFSCVLSGYLDGSVFRSFADFEDQDIHYDYPELNEQYVMIAVDRIDVSFG